MKSFLVENIEIKYIHYNGKLIFKAPKLNAEEFLNRYQIINLNENQGFVLNYENENPALFKLVGRGIYIYQGFFLFKIIQFVSDDSFISLIKKVFEISDPIELKKLKEEKERLKKENETLKSKIADLELKLEEFLKKKQSLKKI